MSLETVKLLSRSKIISLYRNILVSARAFPSIKRDQLIEDIRLEFRENATETDPLKLRDCHEQAIRGLQHLQKYTDLSDKEENWEIELEKNPLGEGGSSS
mmetsp:Transcript_22589/g.29578  ORF Transcript_22589/g.29578 Transcript_22589/m.29578 type:complete len:100 (-) Transcript_22589:390-689(-)